MALIANTTRPLLEREAADSPWSVLSAVTSPAIYDAVVIFLPSLQSVEPVPCRTPLAHVAERFKMLYNDSLILP